MSWRRFGGSKDEEESISCMHTGRGKGYRKVPCSGSPTENSCRKEEGPCKTGGTAQGQEWLSGEGILPISSGNTVQLWGLEDSRAL